MSIKKIAQRAGVSPATVSRVLNNPNYHCSSKELRDKIWQIAMEFNYVPNEAARNLKLGVTPKQEKTYYINVLYMPLFSNDKKCLSCDLDNIVSNLYEEVEGKADGLIIIGKCNKEALKEWQKKYKSIVCVNRNSTNYEVDEVLCNGQKVAARAVEYLIQLGHTGIGYIGDCHNEARYQGYLEALDRHGIELKQNYVIETNQTEAEGFETQAHVDNSPTAKGGDG